MPKGGTAALTSALDIALLSDEILGAGAWNQMSDLEHDAMSSAYRRILLEVASGFEREGGKASELRLLKLKQSGETGEIIVLGSGFGAPLVKFSFVRRNGGWFLREVLYPDTDLHLISETLQPTINSILDRRNNKPARSKNNSEFSRVLLAMEKDPKAAIDIAERALKDDPGNQGLRHLKALALERNDNDAEAIQIWKELASGAKPFAPALLSLAENHDDAEDKEKQKLAIEFYLRYREVEPDDPRTHIILARLYETGIDDARAEAEYRTALKSDPANVAQFIEFAGFLAMRKRFKEVEPLIDEAAKKGGAESDPFGELMSDLYFFDDADVVEALAASLPERMEKSATANLYLGYMRMDNGKNLQAMPLLRKAATLKSDWAEPFTAMARAYRALRNWTAALNAADKAIKLEPENDTGHYNRACALARLGRIKEALKALEKAVEIDPEWVDGIGEEADLKALASQPAFKKLLASQESKQTTP